MNKAAKKYTQFQWGKPVDKVFEVKRPCAKGNMYFLGHLTGITYRTEKNDGEIIDYVHDFKEPFAVLCADETDTLFIVGGGYKIEPRGIVD